MMEIWRKIPALPECYEASSEGRIRTLDRYVPHKVKGCFALRKGRVLKLFDNGRYLTVVIEGRTRLVHRLVLAAFSGDAPFAGAECRHRNGQSRDNRSGNLAWGTGTQNQYDRFSHGTACAGEASYRAALAETDVLAIMGLRSKKMGPKAIASEVGCSVGQVKHVIYGQAWNWLTKLPRRRYKARKNTRPLAAYEAKQTEVHQSN